MIIYSAHKISDSGHQPVYRVEVNGEGEYVRCGYLLPEASQEVSYLSTDFNFGYRGAGPDLLALALMLDATGNPEEAKQFYTSFADDYVTRWKNTWQITDQDIKDWLVRQKGGVITQVSLN